MVNVLIPTKYDDMHAIYVKLALEKKGHSAVLWYTADFPEQQKHTFKLLKNTLSWQAEGVDFLIKDNNAFDVVWLRRPRRPVLPSSIHPDDIENAKNENEALFKTFWQVIAPNAFWVNAIHSAKAVNCKLLQLQFATQVGLQIPETLISNDPSEIKAFIKRNQRDKVIYKTLFPAVWHNKNAMYLTYTREIALQHLRDDAILQNTPGIFQRKIKKQYELRITYFGEYAVSAKLLSQEHPKGISDWRSIPTQEMHIEPFTLPSDIDKKCKAFMQQCGIVFGCFDFIVTPENDYYFLEVNEQGQFLWIEEVNEDIKMLDAFTDFLIQRSSHSNRDKTAHPVALADFNARALAVRKRAMELHKDTGSFY